VNHVDFNRLYFACRDRLPDQKTKALFDVAVVGGMSAYVPYAHVRRVMEIALDTAQSFQPAKLQLVKR
jgi:hypothetical protein